MYIISDTLIIYWLFFQDIFQQKTLFTFCIFYKGKEFTITNLTMGLLE